MNYAIGHGALGRGRGAEEQGAEGKERGRGAGRTSSGERGNFVSSPLPPASSGCKGLIATTATKTLE